MFENGDRRLGAIVKAFYRVLPVSSGPAGQLSSFYLSSANKMSSRLKQLEASTERVDGSGVCKATYRRQIQATIGYGSFSPKFRTGAKSQPSRGAVKHRLPRKIVQLAS